MSRPVSLTVAATAAAAAAAAAAATAGQQRRGRPPQTKGLLEPAARHRIVASSGVGGRCLVAAKGLYANPANPNL